MNSLCRISTKKYAILFYFSFKPRKRDLNSCHLIMNTEVGRDFKVNLFPNIMTSFTTFKSGREAISTKLQTSARHGKKYDKFSPLTVHFFT